MQQREEYRQLTGRVEIDDAYIGGERSGGKSGSGSENQVPFIAAVQTTEDGRPHLACFSQRAFTSEAVLEFMASSLVLPLTVVSDGLACFTVTPVTPQRGGLHDRTVTGGGKASAALEQFQAINTVVGNLKTALTGTYHAIKFAKSAQRYLDAVQYRFNRRYDLRSILRQLVRDAATTLPLPEVLIRNSEAHRQSGAPLGEERLYAHRARAEPSAGRERHQLVPGSRSGGPGHHPGAFLRRS